MLARERRVLRRLVQDRIAGDAAPERTRCCRRSTDSSRLRCSRSRRAARARSALPCRRSANTFSSRSVRVDASRKKSRRASRPLSSLRDWRIGLPTSRVSVRARSSSRSATCARNRPIASSRLRSGTARPGRLRGAGARVFVAHAARAVGGHPREHRAGRGIDDGQHVGRHSSSSVTCDARLALARGIEELVEDRACRRGGRRGGVGVA